MTANTPMEHTDPMTPQPRSLGTTLPGGPPRKQIAVADVATAIKASCIVPGEWMAVQPYPTAKAARAATRRITGRTTGRHYTPKDLLGPDYEVAAREIDGVWTLCAVLVHPQETDA